MTAAAARGRPLARRAQHHGVDRLLGHQRADRAEQDHVENADGGIHLADAFKQAEDHCADARADDAADDHHAAHADVDGLAGKMRDHAGDAGAGHLRSPPTPPRPWAECRRRSAAASSGKPPPTPNMPDKSPTSSPQPDDDERVHREIGDGQVNIHEDGVVAKTWGRKRAGRPCAQKSATSVTAGPEGGRASPAIRSAPLGGKAHMAAGDRQAQAQFRSDVEAGGAGLRPPPTAPARARDQGADCRASGRSQATGGHRQRRPTREGRQCRPCA